MLLLAVLAAACIWSAIPTPEARPTALSPLASKVGSTPARTDIELYRAISRRVEAGEGYYQAAASEQRLAGYPTVPAQAIRLPTLAWVHSALTETGSRVLLVLLAAAATWAWWHRLGGRGSEFPGSANAGAAMVAFGLAATLHPATVYSHEVWAGTLIALSFGIYRPERPALAIFTGLLALVIRELSLPFVLLMAANACWHRRWPELGGWLAVVASFLLLLWLHAQAHAAIVRPGDMASPGWLTLLGVAGFTGKVKAASILGLLPAWAIGPAAMLSLAGWLGWRGELGLTGAMLHGGYALFFCLFGRADNYYWGFVSMPTLLVGLLVVPALIGDLRASLNRTA